MSQFFVPGSGGGGGGITSVVGQSSLVAPTITVTTAAGIATVENRAWQTQYVVDSSTTPGLRGTFQTIQAAITQAVIDGASLSVQKKISIRYGTYSEDLTIPPGIWLDGEAMLIQAGPVSSYCIINGNHTLNTVNPFRCSNLTFTNPSATADLFTNGGSTIIINATDCTFNNVSSSGLIATINFNLSSFTNCTFYCTQYQNALSVSGNLVMTDCEFPTQGTIVLTGSITAYECLFGGISMSGSQIVAYNSKFTGQTNSITGTAVAVTLYNCGFNQAGTAITATVTTTTLVNCYDLVGTASIFPTNTVTITPTQAGSVLPHTEVSSPYSIAGSEQVIYCDTTSAGVTVTFAANLCNDQTWIVKDWKGNAATNNITIATTGGAFIDGATSYTINQNYGSVTIQQADSGNFVTLSQSLASPMQVFKSATIDMKSGTAQQLFASLPSNFIVTSVVNYSNTLTGFALGATYNLGWTATNYDDLGSGFTDQLTGPNLYYYEPNAGLGTGGVVPLVPASTPIFINITVPAVATTWTNTFYLIGYSLF